MNGTAEPGQPDPYVIPDASGYHAGARVWVHLDGAWRPAVVLYGTARAVTARYRDRTGGTCVDTGHPDPPAARPHRTRRPARHRRAADMNTHADQPAGADPHPGTTRANQDRPTPAAHTTRGEAG